MIVFNSTGILIEFDEKKQRLVQTWTGFVTSEVFRKAIDATVDFVKKNDTKSILSDTLNQKVVKPDDREYAASVTPDLFKHGVTAMAFVMPENVLTQLSLKGFAQSTSSANLNFFSNANDAHRWLDTQ
jgi:hypothetical protein